MTETMNWEYFLEQLKKTQKKEWILDNSEWIVNNNDTIDDLKEEVRLTALLKQHEEEFRALWLTLDWNSIINKDGNQIFELDSDTESIIVNKNGFTLYDFDHWIEAWNVTYLERRIENWVPVFKNPNEK